MRPVLLLLAALAPLLGSCQPPTIHAEAVFLDGRLAFVDSEGDRPTGCWLGGVVIDDRAEPVWRFERDGLGECRALLPLRYGEAPERTRTTIAPRAPEPGRLYIFLGDATGNVEAAFALTRVGGRILVHNVDPEAAFVDEVRRRWWERRAAPR